MQEIAANLVYQALRKDDIPKCLKLTWDNPHIWDILTQDLLSFSARDPALWQRYEIILRSQPFQALMLHRLAHNLIARAQRGSYLSDEMEIAFSIAQQNRLMNGADIHPAATIGPGTVLDHVFGMVIGETVEIGKNCYLLGGVTLGARGIADNPRCVRRHPIIGDNVQIGAYARILGAIKVGDDSFIAPHAVITRDVPSKVKVSIINQLQFADRLPGCKGSGLEIYGTRISLDELTVFSNAQAALKVDFVDGENCPVSDIEFHLTKLYSEIQAFRIKPKSNFFKAGKNRWRLRFSLNDEEVYVVNPVGH